MSSWAPDRIDVLLTGSDNGLYHKSWDGKHWVPGVTTFDKNTPGTWVGNPVCISRKPNTIDALAVSTNGKLYHITFDTKGGWNEPVSLGGEWIGPPCAVKQSEDRFDVLMVGLAGGLYHKVFDGGFKPAPDAEWKMVGGSWRTSLSAVSKGTATTSVYGLGTDNAVWEAKWNEQPSDKFTSLGGVLLDPPVAVSWEEGRVDLFGRGTDAQLYHKWYDGKSWQPSKNWEKLCGGYIIAQPKAITWGKGRLDVFGIFADRSLVHCYWDGKSWNGWNKLGGVCLQIDAVVSRTVNRLDVFYRGVDNTSYHKWYDGQKWSPSTEGAESLGTPADESMSSIIPVIGTSTVDPKDHVQPRREINDLHSHHKEQYDLYIRALNNLMARPETHSLSWYGIASIHGVPYIRWPFEDREQAQDLKAGYCCHRSVLFPSWHRIYTILLEQTVQAEAKEIAKEFTGRYRSIYASAAEKLRLPFWDWTINDGGLPRATIYDHVAVAHGGPGGVVNFEKVTNPLRKYVFKDVEMHKRHFIDGRPMDENAPDQIWSNYMETMRCPDDDGLTQHDVVDHQMYKQSRNIRDQVYKLMVVNEYQPFASTGFEAGTSNINNSQSLEGIHDNIHIMCGVDPTPLDGHMGDPMYAGFDPVFWLHHVNVDRVYSLWQSIHPGVHVQPQQSKEDTIMYKMGKIQDQKTPLYPFRHRDGTYFTSPDVDEWNSTSKFGYRYPEQPATFFENNDAEGLKNYVCKAVIDLLGPQTHAYPYPRVPKEAVEKVAKMCELANLAKEGSSYLEGAFQIVPGNYPTFDLNAVHRREWLANLRIENFAVDGSFNIHFFLGEFGENPKNWTQEANLVASHSVFSVAVGKTGCQKCIQDKDADAIVSGGVSLTDALLEKRFGDLEPETIVPYLKEHLQWRVQAADGTHVKSEDLTSLCVTVAATIVESPDEPGELPKWGVPEIFEEITEEKAGGYDKEKTL